MWGVASKRRHTMNVVDGQGLQEVNVDSDKKLGEINVAGGKCRLR